MIGFLVAPWAAPTMARGRLLLATAMTIHIVVGVRFEEPELRQQLAGHELSAGSTPQFVPRAVRRLRQERTA